MAPIERKALVVTDRFLDLLEVLTAAGLVHRVGTVVADQETPGGRARVLNADPAVGDYGLVVRPIPSTAAQPVSDGTLGVVGPSPGAYTVLDRLAQVGLKLDATNAALKQLVALESAETRVPPKATTTLLHRS